MSIKNLEESLISGGAHPRGLQLYPRGLHISMLLSALPSSVSGLCPHLAPFIAAEMSVIFPTTTSSYISSKENSPNSSLGKWKTFFLKGFQQTSPILLAHIEWTAHLWTNDCNLEMDFFYYPKIISPKYFGLWKRTGCPSGNIDYYYTKSAPGSSNVSITREKCRVSGPTPCLLNQKLCFHKTPRWLICTFMFEKHWLLLLRKGNKCWAEATGNCYRNFLVMVLNWFWQRFP